MDQEIPATLNELNRKLSDVLPYKLHLANAREIDFLEKNARYMTKEQFASLTNNIKHDGGLTSLPLCYRQENGKLLVLSGNHRLKAAIEAGYSEFLVLLIDKSLTRDQQIAIQLSHNALQGKDDEQILKELWAEILDLESSIYSGLSTELIEKLQGTDFIAIAEQRPLYKEISLLFLPEEIEQLAAICDGILELVKTKTAFAGRITEYDAILEGMIAVKQNQKIINSTIAFFALAQAVRQYLEGTADSLREAIDEGVHDTVLFTLGSTRRRIQKETAKALRKMLKEKSDKEGMDLDAALLALLENSNGKS